MATTTVSTTLLLTLIMMTAATAAAPAKVQMCPAAAPATSIITLGFAAAEDRKIH